MRKIAHWLEGYSAGESLDIICDLALSHASQGGNLGKRIEHLIKKGRFRELCEFEFDYLEFNRCGYTPQQVYHCRQAVAFFSKLEQLDIGIDKEAAALRKFIESEEACMETNDVFAAASKGWCDLSVGGKPVYSGLPLFEFHPSVQRVFNNARRIIAAMLGRVPELSELGYRFGKGATTQVKKRDATARAKLASLGVSCSEELFPWAVRLLGELPLATQNWATTAVVDDGGLWASVPVHIHDGVLSFVPKNAKTYRATVTEPTLNGLFQMAVGDYLVERFERFGLTLKDQTRNQRLAKRGSECGDTCTIDLVSASDTIAKELVYYLLPLDWAAFLARGRSGHVVYRKGRQRFTLEKFSSMGNGFTFPLESLIFYALTRAACGGRDERVAVYGDDITCPSESYDDVVEILRVCGFEVNRKKSFAWGVFRESCGTDYYRGTDIRPFFQKNWVNGQSLFALHNFYVRRGDLERASRTRGLIHPSLKIFGPDGFGDGHLLGDWHRGRKTAHHAQGYAGYTFQTYAVVPKKDDRPALGSAHEDVLATYAVYRREADMQPFPSFDLERQGDATKERLIAKARFCRIYGHAFGTLASSSPLPEHSWEGPDGGVEYAKALALPTVDLPLDYKVVSVYTLSPN
jgi:hypothetical protein